jgi:hypothetical protein
MQRPLKYSTAGQRVRLGTIVSSTDANTEKDAGDITPLNTNVWLIKEGATTGVHPAAAPTCTADGTKIWSIVLDATDSNTLGEMLLKMHISGCLLKERLLWVEAQRPYNSLRGDGSNFVDTEAAGIKDNHKTAAPIGSPLADAAGTTTYLGHTVGTLALPSDTATQVGDSIYIVSATTGAGQAAKTVLSMDLTDPTRPVAILDSDWAVLPTGAAIVYTSYLGNATPAIPPDANAKSLGGTTQSSGTDAAALIAARLIAPVDGRYPADLGAIANDTDAAENLAKTTGAIARGVVGNGSSTSSIVTSSFDPPGANANQFRFRGVQFDKDTTTTALRGQYRRISQSTDAAAPVLALQDPLTTAPVNGDRFSVV